MISSPVVDLYARNSGLRDKLVAEQDVVLTYALHALQEAGVMRRLAFKGGTCLRKVSTARPVGSPKTLTSLWTPKKPEDDLLIELVETFNRERHGISFSLDDYYKTEGDTSFGGEVRYQHAWNSAGHFALQVSLRERPSLPGDGPPPPAPGLLQLS